MRGTTTPRRTRDVEAAFWGFVGGAALLIGAVAGIYLPASKRLIGLVMAFGSGVLISALAYELMRRPPTPRARPPRSGPARGSLVFFGGDWLIDRRGGTGARARAGRRPDAGATALVLGALLDGIPESAAIGVSLIGGGGVGVAVVAAVFLSNVPESLSASAGMRPGALDPVHPGALGGGDARLDRGGRPGVRRALRGGPRCDSGRIQAFAAGAILTMLADTMVPEAVEHAGALVGLLTVDGFAAAFLLSGA